MHFQGFVNFLTVLKVLVAQSCLIFCNPVACSLPGSSVHGIFQARALAWVVIPYSRDLPDPGIEPRSPTLQADSLLSEPPESPPLCKLLKIMRKLGSLGKLQKPFWLLCYGVSAWLQISMACFSLLVLLHFCSPFLFLGGCNFSTICADFPDFSHFLQAAGALSFFSSCRLASLLTLVGTDGLYRVYPRSTLLHGSSSTPDSLLHGRDCSFHCGNPLV